MAASNKLENYLEAEGQLITSKANFWPTIKQQTWPHFSALSSRKNEHGQLGHVFSELTTENTKSNAIRAKNVNYDHNYKKLGQVGHSLEKTGPSWFTPQPYPYQIQGALKAAYQGHNLIADEPGLGKTIQAILTAGLIKATRILVICPPALITNWATEIKNTNQLDHLHPTKPGQLVTITASNKTTPRLPEVGYVVTSDTLITARPKLLEDLSKRRWDLLIVDESHRLKNYQAKRTRRVWHLSKSCKRTIALTGTPIVSSPLDLLPTLGMLGQLRHFPENFIDAYTVENFWGGRDPKQDSLDDLRRRLDEHVWVRRTKQQVLTQLPSKSRHAQFVDVDDKQLRAAFKPVEQKLLTHVKNHGLDAVDEWAKESRPLVSQLHRGTGLAKIPGALEWITNHVEGTNNRPLIVWAVHTDVILGLEKALRKAHPDLRVRTFYGATPPGQRDQTVSAFQAGEVDVLIAQIIAAGTGLTLTRASDALFVETDWTPANVVQAEDRIHRISQGQPVTITTLLAAGTLDPVIHRVLTDNIETLDKLTPGSDHQVTGIQTSARVSQILKDFALQILNQQGDEQ
ncbi:DEAD/DEAH box helicase [Actinomyces sp.]|uniref:DEAD/DEAH box helicase n=1 Tax=Actinomyces sp. TaxID=29317 RepID=UPI0039777675